MRATFPAHLIFHDLITLTMSGDWGPLDKDSFHESRLLVTFAVMF